MMTAPSIDLTERLIGIDFIAAIEKAAFDQVSDLAHQVRYAVSGVNYDDAAIMRIVQVVGPVHAGVIYPLEDLRIAAEKARDLWLEAVMSYRKDICKRAGTGAHIVLTWLVWPKVVMWYDCAMQIAVRARLAFEAIEECADEGGDCADRAAPKHKIDFLALNREFS